MTVGLVVVSHSRALADAAVELARGMLPGREQTITVAAGDVDGGLGTDATAIADAVTAADSGDGVVVLMDLGSAVLSAETALELRDDDVRARVVLSPFLASSVLRSPRPRAPTGTGSRPRRCAAWPPSRPTCPTGRPAGGDPRRPGPWRPSDGYGRIS